jgi:Putative transposase
MMNPALTRKFWQSQWVVYCKRPLHGPAAVLAYLARYTHRVAISNSRLIACDADGVSFRWTDYRDKGRQRSKVMRLSVDEFICSSWNLI